MSAARRGGAAPQEFLREERIAAAAVEHGRGQGRSGVIAEPCASEGRDVVVGEAAERDVLDDAVAAQVGERSAYVVARPAARGRGGSRDEHGARASASAAARAARAASPVGPLHVIDDQRAPAGRARTEARRERRTARADARVGRRGARTAAQPLELGRRLRPGRRPRGPRALVAAGEDLAERPVGGERLLAAAPSRTVTPTRIGGEAQRRAASCRSRARPRGARAGGPPRSRPVAAALEPASSTRRGRRTASSPARASSAAAAGHAAGGAVVRPQPGGQGPRRRRWRDAECRAQALGESARRRSARRRVRRRLQVLHQPAVGVLRERVEGGGLARSRHRCGVVAGSGGRVGQSRERRPARAACSARAACTQSSSSPISSSPGHARARRRRRPSRAAPANARTSTHSTSPSSATDSRVAVRQPPRRREPRAAPSAPRAGSSARCFRARPARTAPASRPRACRPGCSASHASRLRPRRDRGGRAVRRRAPAAVHHTGVP